jgi:predicted Zn-dependent protease
MNIIEDKIEFIDEMLTKNPQDSYLRYAMAQELLLTGKESEGMSMLEGITKDDREFVYAYYPLGKLYDEKGKKSKAVKNYQKGSFNDLGRIRSCPILKEKNL